MANPTKYVPGYSYSGWQASNPTKPLPAPQVDNDFFNISRSLRETIDALAQIRRSDGKLANGVIGPEQFAPGLSIGFTLRGVWTSGEGYGTRDGVLYDGVFYAANVAHVASIATRPDISPVTWSRLFSMEDIVNTNDAPLAVVDAVFSVVLNQSVVTIPGGYPAIAYVLLEGIRISGWTATDGVTVVFPAITADDLAGASALELTVGVGTGEIYGFNVSDGGVV